MNSNIAYTNWSQKVIFDLYDENNNKIQDFVKMIMLTKQNDCIIVPTFWFYLNTNIQGRKCKLISRQSMKNFIDDTNAIDLLTCSENKTHPEDAHCLTLSYNRRTNLLELTIQYSQYPYSREFNDKTLYEFIESRQWNSCNSDQSSDWEVI